MTGHSPPLWRLFLVASDELARRLSPSAQRGVLATPFSAPAIEDLCLGGLRAWGLTQVRLARLCSKKQPPEEIKALLAIVFSCIKRGYRASPILVDQAVRAAERRGGRPAANFVNALLRSTIEDPTSAAQDEHALIARFNAPKEWIDAMVEDWGEAQAFDILEAMRHQRGHWLRLMGDQVTQKDSLGALQRWATEQQILIDARLDQLPSLWLQSVRGLLQTPLFKKGKIRIQDWSAQQLATILSTGFKPLDPNHQNALDVCSAPGGKTFLMAEDPRLQGIWAFDKSAPRLETMRRELQRLGPQAGSEKIHITAHDLMSDAWPPGCPAQHDLVVLDAPCTASGVVARHPEIPWTNRLAKRRELCETQSAMLSMVWKRLKPGGQLVYITCSVFRAEGEKQVEDFLRREPGARRLSAPGHILPSPDKLGGPPGRDGFFYARILRA